MQLGLAHCPLETEQQPVVEVRRVVHTVLVEDQRLGERADLEQPMPVGRVARQSRDLQAEHHARATHADLGDELLETLSVRRRTRLAKVGVDDDDAVVGPSQRRRALPQRVLALRALCVLDDLPQRRLPHVEVRVALEVAGGDLLVGFGAHGLISLLVAMAMQASTPTTPLRSVSITSGAARRSESVRSTVGEHVGRRAIQAAILSRRSTPRPT